MQSTHTIALDDLADATSQSTPPLDETANDAQDDASRQLWIEGETARLLRSAGLRYKTASFASYIIARDEQSQLVAWLTAYTDNLKDEVRAGRGILLFGSPGTGKDHLLIAAARDAINRGCPVTWVNGIDLFATMRDRIGTGESEETTLDVYRKASTVLVLSDPLPPAGALTDYQATTLYRLVDYRYRNLLPTWCSLNVADAREARERLGAATVDRLRDGSLAFHCNWPSHRKAVTL